MPTADGYVENKEYYTKANRNKYKQSPEYWAKRYRENPRRYYNSMKERRKRMWDFIRRYKESHPCTDCKDWFKSCQMDFDHLGDKLFNIGRLICGKRKTLLDEISKCDLVCSNCHRLRTWRRLCAGM